MKVFPNGLAFVLILSGFVYCRAEAQGSSANLNRLLDDVANAPGWGSSAPTSYPRGSYTSGYPVSMPRPMPVRPSMGSSGYGRNIGGGFNTAAGQSQNNYAQNNSAQNNHAQNEARSCYYRAQDQASRAHNCYNRSFYGDRYSRSQAADEALYAARAARREADRAYNQAASGDSVAQTYADKASAVASSAMADADRARGNADRARDRSDDGW
jgi:hypothetical protein